MKWRQLNKKFGKWNFKKMFKLEGEMFHTITHAEMFWMRRLGHFLYYAKCHVVIFFKYCYMLVDLFIFFCWLAT